MDYASLRSYICWQKSTYAHRYFDYRLTSFYSLSTLPSPEVVLLWLCDKPYELLLKEATLQPVGHPLQTAEFEVIQWRSRSLEEWRNEWDSSQFDAICSALPKLLRVNGILKSDYYRYSYDSATQRGSWFDVDGSKVAACKEQFAVLFTETPVFHYTLLEKIDTVEKLDLVLVAAAIRRC